jgi:Right handed beta helix region
MPKITSPTADYRLQLKVVVNVLLRWNMKHVILFFCLLLAITGLPTNAQADDCTLYVGLNGSDDNSGSSEQPLLTLHHAAELAQTGDNVCIMPGDYPEPDGVDFANSGTTEQPIIFRGWDRGVVIHGALDVKPGTSHLQFYNFALTDFSGWGITLEGNNSDILFSGLSITGGDTGIHLTYGDSGQEPIGGAVENISIHHTQVSNTLYSGIDCTPGPCNNLWLEGVEVFCTGGMCSGNAEPNYGADGIAVERGQPIFIQASYVHDVAGDGIDLNSRDVGTVVEEIIVRSNRVENTATNGIKLWVSGEVARNVVWNTGQDSLVLGSQGGTFLVVNNTIASRSTYGYLAVLGGFEVDQPAKVTLYNNIFYNDNPEMGGTLVYFSEGTILTADNNLYYNPYRPVDVICPVFMGADVCFSQEQINTGDWFAASGQDEHSLAVDPLFTDAAVGNFVPAEGSPLIDGGQIFEGQMSDPYGDLVFTGESPDIGAIQAQ